MEHEESTRYGVSQALIKSRMNTDKEYVSVGQEVFDMLIEEARLNKDWEILSVNRLKKKFNFDSKITILYLMFRIFNHPNIITKDSTKSGKSLRRPIMYRYVSAEEKLSLGFNALYYKKIDDGLMDYLYEQFDESYYDRANSILCVLSYLISFGADKGWVQLQSLRIAARAGMMIKDVIDTLELLEEKQIICINYDVRQLRYTRRSMAVALAKNKAEYARIFSESKDPRIEIYESNNNDEQSKQKEDEIEQIKAAVAQRINEKIKTENWNIGVDISGESAIIENIESKNVSSAYESIIKELTDEVAKLKAEIVRLKTENRILLMKS